MDVVWDGTTLVKTLSEEFSKHRFDLADAARNYNWSRVIDIVSEHPQLINCSRPGGVSLFSPLHQAAYGDAPRELILKLVELGAWRTLRNAQGERPIDVAEREGHGTLRAALEPVYKHSIPIDLLLKIQSHFHEVIRRRVSGLVEEHALRLPELEPLLEVARPKMWFEVPGMYGGFSYALDSFGTDTRLISESWSRVAGGSGQRHEITSDGSRLVEEGFV
jgi:hypothetical protein